MVGVIIGAAAFPLFLLYDIFNMMEKKGGFLFFALGTALLLGATVRLSAENAAKAFLQMPVLSAAAALLAAISFGMLVHVLFFALPAKETYLQSGMKKTVTEGWYALVRHPGVLWLCAFYISLFIMVRTPEVFLAVLVFTILDIIYVWIQEKYIFNRVLSDYDLYRKTTPFLIPTGRSIRAMRGKHSLK